MRLGCGPDTVKDWQIYCRRSKPNPDSCRLARSLGATSTELSQLATVHWDRPRPIANPLHTILSHSLLLVQWCETACLRQTLRACSLLPFPVPHFWYSWTAILSGTYPDFTWYMTSARSKHKVCSNMRHQLNCAVVPDGEGNVDPQCELFTPPCACCSAHS